MNPSYLLKKRQKFRADFALFTKLIDTPSTFSGSLKLPANAQLYVSSSSVVSSPTPVFSILGRANPINIGAGAANARFNLGWFEKGKTLTLHASAPGTITLYVDGGLGQLYIIGQGSSSSFEAETTEWLGRVLADGSTVSNGSLSAYDTFVKSAKTSNYWSAIARLNLFIGSSGASLIPQVVRKGAAKDTNVGTTYSESTGRVSTGVTQYLNTGLIPSEGAGGLFVYNRTAQTVTSTSMTLAGASNSGFTQNWMLRSNVSNAGTLLAGAYMGVAGSSAAAHAMGVAVNAGGMTPGLWHAHRKAFNNAVLRYNGSQVGVTQTTGASNASATVPIYIFCLNSNGTAVSGVTSGTSFGAYGYLDAALSDAQMIDLYNHMQTFQTAIGRQV